jgi:HD superfamily phosphodiesterase
MKILNLSEAKQVALNIANNIEPIDHRDFFLVHSEKVGKVAKMIAQKIGIDDNIFEIAGWVHDIGYSKDLENHADYAIPILQELGYEVNETLKDCILNHGNGKNPQTLEGKIFQLADKFSIFDSDVIEVILKHGTFPLKADDVNFLKMMSEKAFKLLENYTK